VTLSSSRGNYQDGDDKIRIEISEWIQVWGGIEETKFLVF
jgi:hypothetical protein